MSDNKNTYEIEEVESKKREFGKKGWIITVVSIVLVLALTVGVLVAVFNRDFDYRKNDLSKYINVPESLYKSFNVDINIPLITDADVNEEIIKLLYSKRITPEGPLYSSKDVTISAGDVAYVYFRGYTEENGVKSYFDGGCNFDSTYAALGIGAGDFIPGFESGLIGKNQNDYATFKRRTRGTVADGEIVTITYSMIAEDNKTSVLDQTVVIDFADPTLDERWGEGFRDFFIGQEINPNEMLTDIDGSVDLQVADGRVYFDITIHSAGVVDDSEKEKLVVKTTFPYNYEAEDLRGKTGYFEVYIVCVDDYDCYEFNDAFVTDVLGVKAEDLTSYAGNGAAEKYKSFIKQALESNRQSSVNALVEEAFWAQIMAGSEVKKFPKKEVDTMYKGLVAQIVSSYKSQGSSSSTMYSDLDSYARATLELSSTADWQEYLRKEAEEAIKEKLIFYYIVQVEGLTPTEEEYNSTYEIIFNDHLQDYLDYYKITVDTPNYEKELQKGKKEVLAAYGEEYFEELVIYDFVMNEISTRAKINLVVG